MTLYRKNVGIAVFNRDGKVLLAERAQFPGSWQMPQGGIDEGEDPWAGALRELEEEIGTRNVIRLGEIEAWLRYDFPTDHVGNPFHGKHKGQEQKWFAVRFEGEDSEIDLTRHSEIEFARWRWGTLGEAAAAIVDFKRPVYEEVAKQFACFAQKGEDE